MSDPLNVHKTTVTIVDFLEWQRQGTLDLQPIYQRRPVWQPKAKSLLIDSLLFGFPIPLIFLHNRLDVKTSRTMRQVVDGQQRLRTILAYIDIDSLRGDIDDWDEFEYLGHGKDKLYKGLSFRQLPEELQASALQTPLSVNFLPSNIEDVRVLEVFQRLNSTGLKLNAQEARNSQYFGEFKESAYRLAYMQNQRWQDWGIFSRQQIAQMREVELTADLMGYLIDGVRPKSEAAITSLFSAYDDVFPMRDAVEAKFVAVFDALDYTYRNSRSHIRRFRTTAWFYAAFAAVAGGSVPGSGLASALEQADRKIREGKVDEELLAVLRGATADRSSRQTRIEFLSSQVDAPA
jgi:hypothetical protein